MAECAVFTPFLGQFHRGFLEISGMLLELALETLEERDSIGGRARKPRDDLIVVQAASLARGVLHDVIAHGHLTIGDEHGFIVLAHQEHGCAMHPYTFLSKWHSAII